jgi:hypothetical protein
MSSIAPAEETRIKFPIYRSRMAGHRDWLETLLRLYDPTNLSAKDEAFIRAELGRYCDEAIEVPDLAPVVERMRESLLEMLDIWLHGHAREDYQRYLATETWQDKREKVLKRAGYLCEGCRVRRATQVHHRNYDDPRGEEMLFNLVAVCGKCHKDITKRQKAGEQ